MAQTTLRWWGYQHVDGSMHLKRYFSPHDLNTAHESSFVQQVVEPFDADGVEEARTVLAVTLRLTGRPPTAQQNQRS